MGQAIRMMSYSQSKNMSNTATIPSIIINNAPLSFYNLDDGVMGGQSSTHMDQILLQKETSSLQTCDSGKTTPPTTAGLVFTGKINTNGGGFTSIRSSLGNGLPNNAKGLKLKYRGDGKTYKVLISDGKGGGPFSKSPSWQCDLPTTENKSDGNDEDNIVEETCLYFDDFEPSFGGRSTLTQEEKEKISFVNEEMKQIGLMLSLQLSNGDANPVETFGSGIFDFRLEIEELELV